jgi:hypothetical protein
VGSSFESAWSFANIKSGQTKKTIKGGNHGKEDFFNLAGSRADHVGVGF